MKSELKKEGDNNQDDYLIRFMKYHSYESLDELLNLSDEQIYQLEGCTVHLILYLRKLRGESPN